MYTAETQQEIAATIKTVEEYMNAGCMYLHAAGIRGPELDGDLQFKFIELFVNTCVSVSANK